MQVAKEQLERQQMILKALNFYTGKIDGVWGPLTISAKKKFEADPRFSPGMPNNGMPFAEDRFLPAGMQLRKDGLFYHPAIEKHINGEAEVIPTADAAPVAVETVIAHQPPQHNKHQQQANKK